MEANHTYGRRSDDHMINDVNSGTFFHGGMALTDLSTNSPDNVDAVRVDGLKFFIDKSHMSDHMGAIATIPISSTLKYFNNIMRWKNEAWIQIASVQVLMLVRVLTGDTTLS